MPQEVTARIDDAPNTCPMERPTSRDPASMPRARDPDVAAFGGARVLITGGVGLIGSALARRLVGARRRAGAARQHGRRGRRQPRQHRRHRATRVRVNIADIRDTAALRHLLAGPGFPVRSGRADQPSRLDERAGARSRGQLHGAAAAARSLPRGGAGDHDRACRHAPDLRQAALSAGRRGAPAAAARRQRRQQDGRRGLSPAVPRRLRASTPARCA